MKVFIFENFQPNNHQIEGALARMGSETERDKWGNKIDFILSCLGQLQNSAGPVLRIRNRIRWLSTSRFNETFTQGVFFSWLM